jgi:RNA polymerase sigma factor for flagellar operon FliA
LSNPQDVNLNQIKSNYERSQQQITEEFIQEHMAIIKSISTKLLKSGKVPPCIEFQDLISWGIEGLIKAKNKFKEVHDAKFVTYAYYRINGEILDQVRYAWKNRLPNDYSSKKERIRKHISEFIQDSLESSEDSSEVTKESLLRSVSMVHYLSTNIESIISDKKGMRNPETEIIDESYSYIWESIHELDKDDKTLLDLFYIKNWKQNEIANFLNLSKAKTCRQHKNILEKLRTKLLKHKEEMIC